MVMKRTATRVLWFLVGLLLVGVGIACIANPDKTLSGLSILLGVCMLLSGIVDIVIFAGAHDLMFGSGWFLLDGIFTVFLSVFILANRMFTAMTLPFILGMWLLFSGIGRFVTSFDLRRLGMRGWGWCTAAGVLLGVAGFISFLDPLVGALALSWIVGLLLILQGIASILLGCLSNRFWI